MRCGCFLTSSFLALFAVSPSIANPPSVQNASPSGVADTVAATSPGVRSDVPRYAISLRIVGAKNTTLQGGTFSLEGNVGASAPLMSGGRFNLDGSIGTMQSAASTPSSTVISAPPNRN